MSWGLLKTIHCTTVRKLKLRLIMNHKLMTSVLALGLAASGAYAQEVTTTAGTASASAGVALMSPADTGFLYGATVGVNGVGSAAASVAETTSVHGFTGFAQSGALVDLEDVSENARAVSASGVLGTFTFDRDVTVNGSLVGLGTVIAEGVATGASGFTGSAFGNSEFGSTTDGVTDTATTSSANTESEAAMSGSVSTRGNLQLTGSETRFAAANGTNLSESNQGIAYSLLGADPLVGGITINPLVLTSQTGATTEAYEAFIGLRSATTEGDVITALNPEEGIAFVVDSQLGNPIDLSVANAGGGSVALSAQTGGFFKGGSSAFGEFEFGGTSTTATTLNP